MAHNDREGNGRKARENRGVRNVPIIKRVYNRVEKKKKREKNRPAKNNGVRLVARNARLPLSPLRRK